MDSTFLAEFRNALESASERLLQVPEAETEAPGTDGWCAKQILGHSFGGKILSNARPVELTGRSPVGVIHS